MLLEIPVQILKANQTTKHPVLFNGSLSIFCILQGSMSLFSKTIKTVVIEVNKRHVLMPVQNNIW